jgi:hypothetical protein
MFNAFKSYGLQENKNEGSSYFRIVMLYVCFQMWKFDS